MARGDGAERQCPPALRAAWASLPSADEVDVLVVGGGPAGCAAALAAARDGARTLLIEQHGFLGGMATAGLVPAFCPFTDRQRPIIRGIGLAILDEMKASMPHIAPTMYDWVPIDAELLKVIYERRVLEAGASVLFLTHFVDAVVDAVGGVTGAVIHNKSGLQRVVAKVVVDASGDADAAVAAGAMTEKGDRDTGQLQPCTMCFVLAGIDNERFQAFLWADGAKNLLLKEVIAEAKAKGDLDIVEEGANVAYQSPTTVGLNFSHVFDVDGTDAQQLSRAQVEGRRLIRHLTAFMRKYCPGCEGAYIVTSGVQIGVRETRRIVGDYVLTLDDYLARRSFADEIARNSYYIDIHLSKREWERNQNRRIDWDARIHQYQPGESHGIPYRCLIPAGLRNVLVAGRCISTDRAVQGSTRVMPNCLATGEAAGCAAAVAVRDHGGDVRAVDVGDLRARLIAHGAYLPAPPV
jgi:ribulose 1,5-bisphosphate synthetase/thiazole synthase